MMAPALPANEYVASFLRHFSIRSAGFSLGLLDPMRSTKTISLLSESADQSEIERAYEVESTRGREALAALLEREDIQQAIFISSPQAYQNALRKARRALSEGRTDADSRRALRAIFTYVQRLVSKNETTSYFGPMNYGDVDHAWPGRLDYAEEIASNAAGGGEALVTARQVFLSYWALAAIAKALSHDPDIAAVLPVTTHPLLVRNGEKVGISGGRSFPLSPPLRAVFDAVDGKSPQAALVARLGPGVGKLISQLIAAGLLVRELAVSSSSAEALLDLRTRLAALPESSGRMVWLGRLDDWDAWTRTMRDALFEQRRLLIDEGETRFTAQTGLPARRGSGELYEDRSIYYEETRGSLARMRIGRPLHDELSARLAPALALAAVEGLQRWRALGRNANAILERAVPDGTRLSFVAFVEAMRSAGLTLLPPTPPSPAAVKLKEIVANAGAAPGAEVHVDPAELDLPHLRRGAYGLADIFLDASCPEDVEHGHYRVVLRKIHHALPIPSWLTTMHPDPGAVECDTRRWLNEAGYSRLIALEVRRRNKGFYAFPGRRAVYSEQVVDPAIQTVSASRLEIERDEDGGVALFVSGESEPVALYLTLADHLGFAPFAALTTPWFVLPTVELDTFTPRIVLGGAVIQRARWRTGAAVAYAACEGRGPLRFARTLAFRRQLGLPERVFVRTSVDRKPVFIDFAIELCLDLVVSMAQRSDELLIEEMLPGRDQLFLHQKLGGFTSELRIGVALTPVPEINV
ncbi:lantibiotic dehydratase [Rhizobium leguminosarum]|nr:lantibiotic dehydratase [Rhizobium leguminosarum]